MVVLLLLGHRSSSEDRLECYHTVIILLSYPYCSTHTRLNLKRKGLIVKGRAQS